MQELVARIRTNQRRMWEGGQRIPLEALLTNEPGLAGSSEDVLDLIYAEVLLREEFGEAPEAGEYAARFPAHADEIAKQFEVHALFRSGSTATPGGSTIRTGVAFARPDVPGYEIGRQIGHGAWGVVYEARQLSVGGRRVALKIVRPDRLTDAGQATLRRDGEAAGRLSHANVARVYDCGEFAGGLYVALELVNGGTLADLLEEGPLTAKQAARLAEAVASAVHHAHAAGLVHRDLKPSNILLAADGTPKVTDFGLAKQLDGSSSLAASGAIVGTWQYMAPEQAAGANRDVGPAADVWAVGVVLYEMLNGRRPFGDTDPAELLRRVRSDDPPSLPRRLVPRDLAAICFKCLEKKPAARYGSAADLAADLARWLTGEPTRARPPKPLRRTWRAARRRPVILGVCSLLLVSAAGWGGVAIDEWYENPANILQRAMGRRETVQLVGATGRPRWENWHQDHAKLVPLDDGSGVMTFSTRETALLQLAADPGCDRYRLSAELCHVANTRDKELGVVGVFVGYESNLTPEGWQVDRWSDVDYSDYRVPGLDLLVPGQQRRTPQGRVEFNTGLMAATPVNGQRAPPARVGGGNFRYEAPDTTRGLPPWRRVVLTVSPEGVLGEWSSVGQPVEFSMLRPAKDYDYWTGRLTPREAFVPPLRLPKSGWNPRRPIGLLAVRAAVAFRNVTLEPAPSP